MDGIERGGKRLEIHPEGLPKKHRAEFLLHRARDQGADLTVKQFEMDRIKDLPAWQRKKIMPYYSIMQRAEQLGLKGRSLKVAIDQYNGEHPDQKDINEKSFYRNWKKYREQGLDGIMAGHGNRRARRGL